MLFSLSLLQPLLLAMPIHRHLLSARLIDWRRQAKAGLISDISLIAASLQHFLAVSSRFDATFTPPSTTVLIATLARRGAISRFATY